MSSLVGKTIGQYQILLKINSTPTSTVYKAHHTRLGRDVAVQIILPAQKHPAGLYSRLRNHAKTLAQLVHPGIGTLLDCDRYQGEIFLVYDFVPRTILKRRFNLKMSWQQAASCMAPVAQALVFAHQQEVLHGNIRPASIYLTQDGFPVLFDFGIDELIFDEYQKEFPGYWIGSEVNSCMAPERVLGRPYDQRADIYSLGMILFELVFGQRAFQNETPIAEIAGQYRHRTPDFEKLGKGLPPAGQRILKKALAADPDERFQEMQHFSVLLTKTALNQRIEKHLIHDLNWKQPASSFKGVIRPLVLLLTVGIVFSLFLNQLTNRPAPIQEHPAVTVPALIQSPQTVPVRTHTATAAQNPVYTSPPAVIATKAPPARLLELPVLINTPLPGGGETIEFSNVARLLPIAQLGIGWLNDMAWSPTGDQFFIASSTGVFRIDRSTYQISLFFNTASAIDCVAVSAGGKFLATGDSDGLVRLWDVETGTEITAFSGHTKRINQVTFSSDDRWLVSASDDNTARIWDTGSLREVHVLEGHGREVKGADFSPDGQALVTGAMDSHLKVWDTLTGQAQTDSVASSRIVKVRYSPDGKTIVTAGEDNTILLWDSGGSLINRVARITNPIVDLQISPDGYFIAASNAIGNLYVWSLDGELRLERKNERLVRDTGPNSVYTNSLAFSPDSKWISSALWDNTIRYWNIETGEEVGQLQAYTDFVQNLVVSPNNKYLAAQTLDGIVKVWDIARNKQVHRFPGEILPGRAFSFDSSYLALKQNNNALKIFNLFNGSEIVEFRSLAGLQSASFAENGYYLVTGHNSRLRLWSLSSQQELVVVPHSGGGCFFVSDQEERHIAFLTRLGYIDFYAAGAGKLCAVNKGGWMQTVSFNNNGGLIAAGGPGKLQIWQYKNDSVPKIDLEGIGNLQVIQIAIAPDDSLVAAALSDLTIRVWNAESGQEIVRVNRQKERISSLAFTPNGKYLISSSLDGTVLVWGIQ
jgi:WD40 repeat protein/serine/threonine protein kinase